jgi:hypothetical protein
MKTKNRLGASLHMEAPRPCLAQRRKIPVNNGKPRAHLEWLTATVTPSHIWCIGNVEQGRCFVRPIGKRHLVLVRPKDEPAMLLY